MSRVLHGLLNTKDEKDKTSAFMSSCYKDYMSSWGGIQKSFFPSESI